MSTATLERTTPASEVSRSARKRPRIPFGLLAFIVVLAYLVIAPLVHLQSLALSDHARGFRTAFGRPDVLGLLGTTVALALGSVAIAMVLGTGLAIAVTRLPRRLRFLQLVPTMPVVLPIVATVIGWSFLFSPTAGYLNAALRLLPWWSHDVSGPIDVYSLPWIIILTGIGLAAFVFLFVNGSVRDINFELVEAARSSGSSARGAVLRVVLPLLRPVLLYAFGVVFLLGLGQFTTPLLLGRQQGVDVLATRMYALVSGAPTDFASAAALGSPLLIAGVAVVLFQRLALGDQRRFVTHGGKGFRGDRKPSWLAATAVSLYGLLAVLLPLFALFNASLSPFWSGHVQPKLWTLANVKATLADPKVQGAVETSVTVSVAAVLICLPIGFVAASVLIRGRHRRIRAVLDVIVSIPLAVPAVVLGMGFLVTYSTRPLVLYGTEWVIILVYVAMMVPYSTRMLLGGLIAIGRTYTEASRVSGASMLKTDLRITLPLLRPALGGAAGLMFVLLSQEFSASLLVRAPTVQVMGTELYDYYTNGSYPAVATMALLMFVVTGLGLAGALLIGGRRAFDRS